MSLKDTETNLPCLCRFINIYKTNQKSTHRGRRKLWEGIKICLIEEVVICHNERKDIVLIQGYTDVIFEQGLETRPHLIYFFQVRYGFSVFKTTISVECEWEERFSYPGSWILCRLWVCRRATQISLSTNVAKTTPAPKNGNTWNSIYV